MSCRFERGQAILEAVLFVPAFCLLCAGGLWFASALRQRTADEGARARMAHTAAWFPLAEREGAGWPGPRDANIEAFRERKATRSTEQTLESRRRLFGPLGLVTDSPQGASFEAHQGAPSTANARSQARSSFLPAASETFEERVASPARALASSLPARSVSGHPARHGGLAGGVWRDAQEPNLRLLSTDAFAHHAFESLLARTAARARALHHAACVAASLPTSFGVGGLLELLGAAVTDGVSAGSNCPGVSAPVDGLAFLAQSVLHFQAGKILALEACAANPLGGSKCAIPRVPGALDRALSGQLDRGDPTGLRRGLGSAL